MTSRTKAPPGPVLQTAKAGSFSTQLQEAIRSCGKSRYLLSREAGIDAAILCRFLKGQGGLSLETIDKLSPFIGLQISYAITPNVRG